MVKKGLWFHLKAAFFAVATVVGAAVLFALLLGALGKASEQGPFKNWGLINSQFKSYIDAPCAWHFTEGSKKVIIAIIDTGVDSVHYDLAQNVIKGGWNFVSNNPNTTDENGHGTHVAGIIGAIEDLAKGSSGVAHQVSILPIKYYSDANPGSVNLKNTVKAIRYAVKHGAKIINYSGGGPEFSEDEYLALKYAEKKGVLVVAAAGNEHQDVDFSENYYYPAAYRLPNIIVVAATDIRNNLLGTSNWGLKRVDVAAPGENIFSTLPNDRYGYMSGTSQATAFVSGIAALVLSLNPKLTPVQVKKIILETVDKFPQLEKKMVSGGRVNACSAVQAVSVKP